MDPDRHRRLCGKRSPISVPIAVIDPAIRAKAFDRSGESASASISATAV
jgi:hypothetical protein